MRQTGWIARGGYDADAGSDPEMVGERKLVWDRHRSGLRPNRKTGDEIAEHMAVKYPPREITDDERATRVVSGNALRKAAFAERLPIGQSPSSIAFIVENAGQGAALHAAQEEEFEGNDILVGIDRASGFCRVEGSGLLWDEVCAFQGLDEKDIENWYCVAEYISCLKTFSSPDGVPDPSSAP